ncbi:MBL fold metallo-hydrolase [Vitiosangium sp. GDMCC 1.1324]|uniref:MBL fold metallo-hydrolase n=1 Tax=Vitiosangium sp. (strain GDMCC 1.1324) TaxID=2138576 RepID=UPI000D3873DA|nr:MBL fold metallo-hydrolase [Vitiosangium sp. GDMCC 1.1324]PTL79574.1 MBL fold metallo-hydrolase [Vitiosangium sp. GDMCC 1.1324]
MRIHHLNGTTFCPPASRLLLGHEDAHLVCHCLLIETHAGLVLVDTAMGLEDMQAESHRAVRRQLGALRPRLDPEQTMARQVEKLGYRRGDVRHIVLTHLDSDHAGGLPDFPRARVHVYAREHAAALAKRSLIERMRYVDIQWAHGPDWKLYESARGEPWFGFECVRQLEGLPPELLLVPLVGHTRGHCAVAVNRGDSWLLHAGDAYFHRGEVNAEPPHCPAGLRFFQSVLSVLGPEQRHNQERLRELARTQAGKVRVFCAHDEEEWRSLAGKAAPVGTPATSSSEPRTARG